MKDEERSIATQIQYRITEELVRKNEKLQKELEKRKRLEQELIDTNALLEHRVEERTHDLGERIKELTGLYSLSRILERQDIPLEETLEAVVEVLPPAWRYPEITCARITFGGHEFTTGNFEETIWKQASDIIVHGEWMGTVEVFYLEEKPELDEGPFLKEERNLINEIAARLGETSDRKQAEKTLREKEHFQNALLNDMLTFVAVLDSNGNIIFVNNTPLTMSGIELEDVRGKKFIDAFWWAYSDEVQEKIKGDIEQCASGESIVHDVQFQTADGSLMWVEYSMHPIYDEHGVVQYLIPEGRDITERKQAEEALQSSDKRFRALYDNNPNMLFTIDEYGKVLSVNQFGIDQLGYSKDQLVGKLVINVFHEEDRPLVQEYLKQCFADPDKVHNWELRKIRQDGTVFYVYETVRVVDDVDGKPTALIVCEDITERKQAEETLRESNERFRAAFVDAAIGMALVSLDHSIIEANQSFCNMLGYSKDELVGVFFRDITHPDDVDTSLDHFHKLIAGEIDNYHFEKRYLHKQGHKIWALLSVSLIRDKDATPLYAIAQMQDITERKKAEMALKKSHDELEYKVEERTQDLLIAKELAEAASIAKGQFLANMSHELRTPLNATIGYSELIMEEAVAKGDNTYIPDLQKINAAGKHLLSLINDILDLSKIEEGKMELFIESFGVATLIDEVRATIQPLMEKNGNELTVKCSADIGGMHTDMTKLRQVLFNLLSNAAKFTEKGRITMEVERDSEGDREWLTFQIKDTGIGMTPEQQIQVFDGFKQADLSIMKKFGGTGLGLTLCTHLCEMMDGAIHVESHIGKGSTFTVRLPAEVVSPGLKETET